jgi:CRISPR-associated endonuclease/helicase Cas3
LWPGERPQPLPLDEAIAAPYPLLTHRSTPTETLALQRDENDRTVLVTAEPLLEKAEAVAQRALAAAREGAKTLVIRNTVTDCIATQQELEWLAAAQGREDLLFSCHGQYAPHHARFARPDRVGLDIALESRLGKERPEGGCVVVATQTVQQSLDLDADFLISDLCPADILLQRMGRLHRHIRERPPTYRTPAAVVIVPADRDLTVLIKKGGLPRNYHGLGSVYPDLRIIEATWRLIESHPGWRLPEMNRMLVERSLHSQILAGIVHGGAAKWRDHEIQVIGAGRGHARLAQLNVVDWTHPYADSSFPDASDQRIQTRLGEGDRLVHFNPPIMGPFSNAVEELVIPAWLVRGLEADIDTAGRVRGAGTIHFDLGPYSFVYDRLGLRRRPPDGNGR